MDWSKVGGFLLENGLPLLGGLVGGPAGAGIGTMIAGALGSDDDPNAVMAAIQADPKALVALKTLQENNRAELEKLHLQIVGKNLTDVNETMRVEIKSESRFVKWARPSLIWSVSASVVLEIIVGGFVVLVKPDQMAQFVALCSAIAIPQGVAAAMCGVYMKQRTNDKAIAAGAAPGPGLLAGLFNRGG